MNKDELLSSLITLGISKKSIGKIKSDFSFKWNTFKVPDLHDKVFEFIDYVNKEYKIPIKIVGLEYGCLTIHFDVVNEEDKIRFTELLFEKDIIRKAREQGVDVIFIGGSSKINLEEDYKNIQSSDTSENKEIDNGLTFKIDIGIITFRQDEFDALSDRFPEVQSYTKSWTYSIRKIKAIQGGEKYIALSRTIGPGTVNAQAVANHMISDLKPGWIFGVGIGGGVPSDDFLLGDVLLGSRIHDFSVVAKKAGEIPKFDIDGGAIHINAKKFVAGIYGFKKYFNDWNTSKSINYKRPELTIQASQLYGDEEWKSRIKSKVGAQLYKRKDGIPQFIALPIGSSNILLKDIEYPKIWEQVARSVSGYDMESAGIFNSTQEKNIPFLAIRGISDIIGLKRKDEWTKYACNTVASCTVIIAQLVCFFETNLPGEN